MAAFNHTHHNVQYVDSGLLRRRATPMYPQYEDEVARENTFQNWPNVSSLQAPKLFKNGFAYSGIDDLVHCFHCGVGLRNWTEHDDPMKEHSTLRPNCQFLENTIGKHSIKRSSRTEHEMTADIEVIYNRASSEVDGKITDQAISHEAKIKEYEEQILKQRATIQNLQSQCDAYMLDSVRRAAHYSTEAREERQRGLQTDDPKYLKQKINELQDLLFEERNNRALAEARCQLLQEQNGMAAANVIMASASARTDEPPCVAFQALLQNGYRIEIIVDAAKQYFEKYRHNDFKGEELCKIILETEAEKEMNHRAGIILEEDGETVNVAGSLSLEIGDAAGSILEVDDNKVEGHLIVDEEANDAAGNQIEALEANGVESQLIVDEVANAAAGSLGEDVEVNCIEGRLIVDEAANDAAGNLGEDVEVNGVEGRLIVDEAANDAAGNLGEGDEVNGVEGRLIVDEAANDAAGNLGEGDEVNGVEGRLVADEAANDAAGNLGEEVEANVKCQITGKSC